MQTTMLDNLYTGKPPQNKYYFHLKRENMSYWKVNFQRSFSQADPDDSKNHPLLSSLPQVLHQTNYINIFSCS